MSIIETISVEKAMALVGGGFEALTVDPSPLVRKPVKTSFFNSFFNPVPVFSEDDVYQKLKVVSPQLQLPVAKAFHEIKGALDKKTGTKSNYNIGSWGNGWNIKAQDVKSRISPSTGQRMTIAELIADMSAAAADSWVAFEETGVFTLLTTDANYTQGSSAHTQYDWHTEMEGSARGAATSMQLAGTPAGGHEALFRAQVDLLQEDALKQGVSPTGRFTCLCGTTFFNSRRVIEEAAGNPREIQYGPDLSSSLLPEMQIGGFRHAYFDSRDGIRYIHVNDSVATGAKIGANNAYLVNEGIPYFSFIYTKAQTLSGIEAPVQKQYAYTMTHDRNGIVRVEESNVLFMSNYPKLIRVLTV